MKVLVINPIMYTSETKNIKRAASIKDTMMYDFCLAFHEMGHSITLVGGEPFKPTKSETYPFEVLWWECKCQKVCMYVSDPPFGYKNFLYYAFLRQNTIYRYKIIINHYI